MGGKPLGYKIKYINNPGYKTKKALYEIKPGKWVTKSRVPEYKAKSWSHNNKWNNSEKGFIMNLYSSARTECKKGRHGNGIPIPFEFTKKTWWEQWKKQKKKYGMKDPYSKVTMTMIRGRGRGTTSGKNIPTNVSKDQIWPGRGYTIINLIFCSVKFNLEKKSITPDGCEAVIDVYNQRMDDWANEMVLQRELRKIDISRPENLKYFKKEFRKFKRSVSEKEYKRFIEIAYQKAIAERKASARS